MIRTSLPRWAEGFQASLSLLFALSPAAAVAYVQFQAPAGQVFIAHHLHEIAITVAVAVSLFLAYLAYRCHRDSGEPLTRHLALGFFGFAVVYAPHGALTFMAQHQPALFLLWGPASRLVMATYVLRGLLAPRAAARPRRPPPGGRTCWASAPSWRWWPGSP
ncbi:MAG: hypothetical protein NVV74_13845 [Magnetospirillum sp.]|nr:hypothetical protein [Magnetospirillum sp.]